MPPTLTALTDSQVKTLQAGQTFVAKVAPESTVSGCRVQAGLSGRQFAGRLSYLRSHFFQLGADFPEIVRAGERLSVTPLVAVDRTTLSVERSLTSIRVDSQTRWKTRLAVGKAILIYLFNSGNTRRARCVLHRSYWTDTESPTVTTIATKKCPIYFSNDIGKMQLRSVASDW